MALPDWVDAVSKLGTLGIAAVSATYAYLQYRRSQKWKSSDLAASLMEKLSSDPQLALACHSLDWGVGPLIVPEQYRELLRKDREEFVPTIMQHEPMILCRALEPYLNEETVREPRGLIYRYAFIRLFEHLHLIATLLESRQIRVADIEGLRYWLRALRAYPYSPPDIDSKAVFSPAIEIWEYDKIFDLARQLGIEGWQKSSD